MRIHEYFSLRQLLHSTVPHWRTSPGSLFHFGSTNSMMEADGHTRMKNSMIVAECYY